MKITKAQLKQIIKEELKRTMESQEDSHSGDIPRPQGIYRRPERPDLARAFDLGHEGGMAKDWDAMADFLEKHGKDSREAAWFKRGWDNAGEEDLMLRLLKKDPIERRAFLAVHRRKPTHNI